MNEELRRIHLELMLHSQKFRMRNETPPKIFLSKELYDDLFSSEYGEFFVKHLDGLRYFGIPCKVEKSWKGIRYIVGYEGGEL